MCQPCEEQTASARQLGSAPDPCDPVKVVDDVCGWWWWRGGEGCALGLFGHPRCHPTISNSDWFYLYLYLFCQMQDINFNQMLMNKPAFPLGNIFKLLELFGSLAHFYYIVYLIV